MTIHYKFESQGAVSIRNILGTNLRSSDKLFAIFKRSIDLFLSLLLVVLLVGSALILLMLNSWLNPGKLFFVQKRMGKNCQPFNIYKFRTMIEGDANKRSANCPLEIDRITCLGYWLRKFRIDELPQVLNVLKGDMSLIGPRPDAYHHAQHFAKHVRGYVERHQIRPGISGYAQTEIGYVEGTEATRQKVAADHYYINNQSLSLDLWIAWRSFVVILCRAGT